VVTRKQARVAAWAVATILAVVAVVQLYAVLDAALGADPPATGALVLAALVGLLALAAAVVLLVRVGYLPERVRFDTARRATWWVGYASAGGAVLGFAGQMDAAWYVAGPVNLVIALLALAVARSEPPLSVTAEDDRHVHAPAGQAE
jgi:hypothetical protein